MIYTTLILTALLCASSIVAQEYQSAANQQQPARSQQHFRRERVSWCTTNLLEKKKCLDWARAIEEVNIQFEGREPFELNLDCAQGNDKDHCMSLIDDERADMILLDPGEIGVAGRYHSLTPIMMERYGVYGGFSSSSQSKFDSMGHYSVAIVKRRSAAIIQSLHDLWGKKACFSGVSHMASWTLPLSSIIDLPRFEIADCNNLVKSASYFFGNSCAPNALIDKFNPTGDNPQSISALCERLGGRVGAHHEPYNGAFSALKCLSDPISLRDTLDARGGDVAFLPHNTLFLSEKLNLPRELRQEIPSRADLELLCPRGGRAPLDRWQSCNFGFVPAHAVIVSSRTSPERRETIQKFLKASIQIFAGSSSLSSSNQASTNFQQRDDPFVPRQQQQYSSFDSTFREPYVNQQQQLGSSNNNNFLFQGVRVNSNFKLTGDYSFLNYPSLDVLFSSDMVDLVPLTGASQTFKGYLNSFPVQVAEEDHSTFVPKTRQSNAVYTIKKQTDYFEKLRWCSVPAAVLCVTSDKEFSKCLAMSKAFHAAGLKPELNCKLAQSTLSCMQLIKSRDADLVVLDPAEIYLAGSKFDLLPIVAEQIERYESSNYAIAVAKKSDQSTDLFSLKGKLSCHSGFLKAAGWIMPMSFLISNDRMRKYDYCDSARSAAEHFDKSCAPGALLTISNTQNSSTSWTVRNLCELCHGTGRSYCARDASEPFYGDTGSFRCLVEGGGQVAFLKHAAIFENTGGSNRETWARNLIKSDFELLCRDGSRAAINEYKSCNLGSVPSNAIVTSKVHLSFQMIDAYMNLFMYGQQYYGSKYSGEYTFKMFSSTGNGKDLIFQDATQQLVRVPVANQTYKSYLGLEFIRAMETVFCNE